MYVHVKEAEGVVATIKTGTLAKKSVLSLIIWISLLLLLCLIVMIDLFDLYVFAV